MTAGEPKKPNWLLRGFLLVSIGIHAWVLGHATGLYESRALTYIELEMREDEKPPGRSIPTPPQRQRRKLQLDAPNVRPVTPASVKTPIPPPVASLVASVQQSLVEPVTESERPDVSKLETIAWSPAETPRYREAPSHSGSAAHGSSRDYLSMVRLRIENRKQYPYAARKRQVQGRVVVRFVIGTDGSLGHVSLVEKSRHELLNEAAIEAVRASSPFPRPPARLFTDPVLLEISMVFELM